MTHQREMPREEGHYWVRFGQTPYWDVYYFRDGCLWDHHDCGFRPEDFEIGHRVYPPNMN